MIELNGEPFGNMRQTYGGGSWFVEKRLIADRNWQEIGRLVKETLANIA